MKFYLLCILVSICTVSCIKENDAPVEPKLIFRFRFDSTQVRLSSTGQPASVPAGHAAQSPFMNTMSVHYIELSATSSTALGKGAVIYKAPETNAGGDTAIDFSKSILTSNNEVFYAVSLKDIAPGEYEWLRMSLAYQNYTVKYHFDTTINGTTIELDSSGVIASFIGYNTYITSYQIKTQSVTVNENRKQGYWGFETTLARDTSFNETYTVTGQSPEGSTTVVNPIFDTSPVPAGSCVVTAAFVPGKLVITGKETENIIIEVAVSTNKSFEWIESNNNGKWDPAKGESVVDMGIRGIIPTIK